MKPGITLYFVRHGQTEWNRARRIPRPDRRAP